jgi:hypothetical protein
MSYLLVHSDLFAAKAAAAWVLAMPSAGCGTITAISWVFRTLKIALFHTGMLAKMKET